MTKIISIFLSYLLITFNTNLYGAENDNQIKIGLLAPFSGQYKNLGESLLFSTQLALSEIGDKNIVIIPRDSGSDDKIKLNLAVKELIADGVKIVIGPIFHKSLDYLEEVDDVIFLALTNKTNRLPENVISSGVNSTSQLSTIKKFIDKNEIKKTIFLTPKKGFEDEIKKGISGSKLKISKLYKYDSEPTKLTSQIEKITNYKRIVM